MCSGHNHGGHSHGVKGTVEENVLFSTPWVLTVVSIATHTVTLKWPWPLLTADLLVFTGFGTWLFVVFCVSVMQALLARKVYAPP